MPGVLGKREMTNANDWSGAVGEVWADEWRCTDRAFADLSIRLDAAIVSAAPPSPFRAFDIGCGAGGTSLALAAARPDGDILGGDLSQQLVAVARERADGVPNLRFETGDAPSLAEANGPFDLLCSRHGVMFFSDRTAAFARLRSATRHGGALVFSCFGDPDAAAFAGPLARALDLPVPRAGDAPGPFAFADPVFVADLLTAAGWRDTRSEPVSFGYRVGAGITARDDAVRYLSRIGPAAAAIRGADPTRRDRIRAGLNDFLIDYVGDSVVDLPAQAWLWSARA